MIRLKFFKMILLSMVLMISVNIGAAPNSNIESAKNGHATWLWHTEKIIQNSDQIISFLLKNNVKHLYLQIDYDLDTDVYKAFIEKASINNINVHALEGSPEWAADNGTDWQQQFFDWLIKYQEAAAVHEKFTGIHLDVEPYLKEQYLTDRNSILENYQDLLSNVSARSVELGLALSVSVPFWFDEIAYETKYGNGMLAEWVISHIKNVVIMAYRDQALGNNGIIKLVSKEIELAEQYNTSVIVAVETQQSDEGNNISFYEEGQDCMNDELNTVYDNYKTHVSFNGFAMHHVMSWMALKE